MNIPRKAPGSKKGLVNNQVSGMILTILNSLEKKPENKGKDKFEILKNFLDYYSIDGNPGLLEEISKTGNISFDMIKDDGFDIDQIIGDDRNTGSGTLHNILNDTKFGAIGKDIEKVIIQKLVERVRGKVPSGLQANFDKEVNNPSSLNEFKNQIWNLFEFGGMDDNLKNEIKKIKITNKDIVDGLIGDGKLDSNDIAGDYKNRNAVHKKSFDKIITQEYIGGLKKSVNFVEKNVNMLKDTFTNFVPNMGWILDKYPYDIKEIDTEILKKIDEAQEKGNKEESDKLSFYAYIELVQNKNKKLGDILSKLFQNKFDFTKLSNEEQSEFLSENVGSRLEGLKAGNIANLLEVDQDSFDKFVKDIFDLNKNEIIIPSAEGDIKLGINKKFRGGENPDFADISKFTESKLPIEFDIEILEGNKDLIDNTALKYVFANEISDDGKSIKFNGGNIGKLLLMYTLGEASFDKKDMNPDKVAKLKKLLDLVDKKIDLQDTEITDNERNALISDNSKEDNEILKRERHFAANEDEIRKNGSLEDIQRILKSKEKINLEGKEYNDAEEKYGENDLKAKAILESHYSTVYDSIDEVPADMKDKVKKIKGKYYEMGKDGERVAGLRNYTNEQIKHKVEILKKVGFNSWQIKILLQDGFCGIDSDKLDVEEKAERIIEGIEKGTTNREKKVKKEASNYYAGLKNKELRELFTGELEAKLPALALLVPPKDVFTRGLIDELKQHAQEQEEKKQQEEIEENEKKTTEERKEAAEKESPFLTAWKNIKGYEFPEDKENFGFVKGTRLWIKFGDTELPPADKGGDQWIQLEIVKVTDKNFKVKLTGGELSAGSFEGKEFSYPRTKDSLDLIINAFDGEVYKLPEAKNWDKSLGNIKSGGLSNLKDGINVFDEIKYENGKFISNIEKDDKNNGKEITHFGADERTYDENGKEKIEPVFYKISHNNNGTITLEYKNYKRQMDYNNFIIFISTKNLKPAAQDHVDEIMKNFDNEAKAKLGGRKLKFFSISNIFSAIKGAGKKINESIKKYNDEKTDAFSDFLVTDVGIFKKLTAITSFIPGVGDAIQGVELDYHMERDAKVWKKIEKRIQIFEKDPDFGTTFKEKGFLRPYLGGGSLQDMVISGKLPKMDRHIAAATLIALISKGKSPYRDIQGLKMKGAWVKLLLGEGHQKRFLEHQQELIREIENNKGIYGSGYDAQMTNDLVRAEMTYLINNIGGRATGQRFGQIPKDDDPKSMRSDKFAGELESKYNERIGQSKIDEEFNKMKHITNFTFCYNEFKRFSGSGRSHTALACLKKMATLAKSPQQKSILKMSIVGGMLNGFFLNFADKDTKGWLQSICRSMGFSPGLWIVRYEQKEKMAHVLDYISNGKFSKDMKYNTNDFGANAKEIDYAKFFGGDKDKGTTGFEGWRNKSFGDEKSNGNHVENFLKKLPIMEEYNGKKISDDHIIMELKGLSIESQVESTDKDVDTNSKVITDSPLSQTKGFIQQKMLKYENGTFKGEVDEIQAAEDFWNGVSKQISKGINSKKELEDITRIFFNRFDNTFDDSGKISFVRRLATIKKYINAMGGTESYEQEGGGFITKKDMRNVMWYSTVGEICKSGRNPPSQLSGALESFLKIFWDNEKFFDREIVKSVLGREYLEHFEKPYKLVPWSVYNDISGGFGDLDIGGYLGEDGTIEEYESEKSLSKDQKQDRANKRKQFRNDDIFLNKKLKDMEKDLSRKGILSPSLGLGIGDINKDKPILKYR